jgi:hypothetical protein
MAQPVAQIGQRQAIGYYLAVADLAGSPSLL